MNDEAKQVGDGEQTPDVLVFDKGEEVMAGLLEFVKQRAVNSGHLLDAHVWPTLEVVLVETPAHLQRELDEETGLPLIRL